MAETLTTFVPQRITLGSSNVATRVILPRDCRRVAIKFETNAGKYSTTGTDGQAIDGTDYATMAADTWHSLAISRQSHGFPADVYLASATGSTVVQVLPEAE